jgi:hypothetical protein
MSYLASWIALSFLAAILVCCLFAVTGEPRISSLAIQLISVSDTYPVDVLVLINENTWPGVDQNGFQVACAHRHALRRLSAAKRLHPTRCDNALAAAMEAVEAVRGLVSEGAAQPLMRSAAPCVVLAIFGSATRCT